MARKSQRWPKGCQPPSGYVAWHSWAEDQQKYGLRPASCCMCGLWRFPQEMGFIPLKSEPMKSDGTTVVIWSPVCLKCCERKDKRGVQ